MDESQRSMFTPLPSDAATTPRTEKNRDVEAPRATLRSTGKELSDEDYTACLAMSKAVHILGTMETTGSCGVERSSVYGAALAMPQIGRSALWPKTMCFLAARTYAFLLINICVQTLFCYYIYDSQSNMNPFGGQMHLCDFAAHVASCPGKPNCHGPGGKEFQDPGSLYPYDVWNTRKFVRDSLQAIFPHLEHEIAEKVDPGEYGLEGYYCRLLCIFVFMVGIGDEFQSIRDLSKLLYYLPTTEGKWVSYHTPTWAEKHEIKRMREVGELEFVRFKVQGMPMRWKIFNVCVLLLPKIFIWRMLSLAGVHFLMETAAMVDQIVNTTALSFVFSVDELIFERLSSKVTRHMMEKLEDYNLYDEEPFEKESDQQALDRYDEREMKWSMGIADYWLLPRRLFWSVVLMLLFLAEYYAKSCRQTDDGSWVSVDMFLPVQPHLDVFDFVKNFVAHSGQKVKEAFWTMPHGL